MNTKQLAESLKHLLSRGLVPMVHGSPGIAKSAVIKQVADNNNLKLIDLRLSQCTPEDLLGLPTFNENKTKASYAPFTMFPLEDEPLPSDYDGWLLFLDEVNSASLSVQSAAFKLILDRMVGQFSLHKRVAIVCAGNKATDKGITNRISTPMQSRLIHLDLDVDVDAWLEWANKEDIDSRIISFIKFKNNALYSFDPNHNDKTFPSPRTYEFLSKIIKGITTFNEAMEDIIHGTIGKGVGIEFITFSRIYLTLPKFSEILNGKYRVPSEPSILFVIAEMIVNKANKSNLDSLSNFINKMPKEYQVIIYKDLAKQGDEMINHPVLEEWIEDNTEVFYN